MFEHITDKATWNHALAQFPQAHILQTWEWGAFKHLTTGWHPYRLLWRDSTGTPSALASVGMRKIGIFTLLYAPKGFVTHFQEADTVQTVLADLEQFAHKNRALWLKIDPDLIRATGEPNTPEDAPNTAGQMFERVLSERGWRFSEDQVQFRNTLCIDLTQSEEAILAQMSQNTRRKVRTAEKKNVLIRQATPQDLPTLYALYQTTGERDDFLIRPFWYYQKAWGDFMQAGLAQALIAEYEGQPIAHVILFHFGQKCWYFYGASANIARETMPNYALQWEAMKWAKSAGYTTYDMWGAPNEFLETDPLWGVYEFKRGFRGTVTRHVGAWDYAPNRALYWAYTRAIPSVRQLVRYLLKARKTPHA